MTLPSPVCSSSAAGIGARGEIGNPTIRATEKGARTDAKANDGRLEACRRLRVQGRAEEALRLLAGAPPRTSLHRVEAALCAFDIGDAGRMAAFVADDASARRAVAPLLAVLAGDGPPPTRNPALRGLSAIARATRLAAEGDLDGARQRLHSVPKSLREVLDYQRHTDVLKVRRGKGAHALRAAYQLLGTARDDPEALEAIASTIGSVPRLAEGILARRTGLDDRARRACARSLRHYTGARADSPASLLARDPASVPVEHRGRLHLHRGFALLKSEPARAEVELDAALARGEDALEVWRGRFLAARDPKSAQRALERLMRAVERGQSGEAQLLVGVALLEVLVHREQFEKANEVMKRLDRVLESLRIEGSETIRAVESHRLALLEHRADPETARRVARALTEKVPSAAIGWTTLIALEEDPAALDDLVGRARLAVESGPSGPRKQRDLDMLDEASTRATAHVRATRGIIETAGEWARAYVRAAEASGAPCAAHMAVREALDDDHRRATIVVEAALRAHRQTEDFPAWLASRLADPDGPLALGVAEVVGQIAPHVLRRASRALPTERVVFIASSARGVVARQLLLEHAHRLAGAQLPRLRRAAGDPPSFEGMMATERVLDPHFALFELVRRGDEYQPIDAVLDDVPPELQFMEILPPARQSYYLDELAKAGLSGGPLENMAVLRPLVEEVKAVAAARGVPDEIPMVIEMLASFPPGLAQALISAGLERADDFDGTLDDGRPVGHAPALSARQRSKKRAVNRREKKNRKRGRKKKK